MFKHLIDISCFFQPSGHPDTELLSLKSYKPFSILVAFATEIHIKSSINYKPFSILVAFATEIHIKSSIKSSINYKQSSILVAVTNDI